MKKNITLATFYFLKLLLKDNYLFGLEKCRAACVSPRIEFHRIDQWVLLVRTRSIEIIQENMTRKQYDVTVDRRNEKMNMIR